MIGNRTSKPGYKNTRKSGYVFKQYCDPAHSWYKVEISFLRRLNIEKNISGWSFVRGEFSMDEIREKHGSQKVTMKERGKLRAA